MSYVPGSTDFNLSADQYRPPGSQAVDFDLAGGDVPPGPVYPIPPGFMVTACLSVDLASQTPSSRAPAAYSMTPAQKVVRAALSSNSASAHLGDRAPQGWDRVPVKDASNDGDTQPWGAGAPRSSGQTVESWDRVPIKDEQNDGATQPWATPERRDTDAADQGYNVPPPKDGRDRIEYRDSAKYWEAPPAESAEGYVPGSTDFNLSADQYGPPGAQVVNFNLLPETRPVDQTVPTRPIWPSHGPQGWNTNLPVDKRLRQPWDTKPRIGTDVDFDYGGDPDLPPKPEPDQPEIKDGYLFMNASYLKKLPEGTPLEFQNLGISLDLDSFSWALSCEILNQESMDLIAPGPAGPVEVETMVNGHVWRFMVERYSLTRNLPSKRYRISGSSVTQLLAAPYSPKTSAQITTPTNAQQVIQALLDLTDFSVIWDASLPDYTIPAGAWGYQDKTPIEVIDQLVKAAGGVLVPDLSLSQLKAAARYREGLPWYWPGVDSGRLDFIIADDIIRSLSSEWRPAPLYNGVYVSGITQGVAVDARRNGTDGTPAAPDNYDALNLTTQQCRSRATAIIGQSGSQEIVTIEIPIPTSGAPGLVVPGQWGEVQNTRDPAKSWRCLVLSTQVQVSQPGGARAVQLLKLERHHY